MVPQIKIRGVIAGHRLSVFGPFRAYVASHGFTKAVFQIPGGTGEGLAAKMVRVFYRMIGRRTSGVGRILRTSRQVCPRRVAG